MATKESNAMEIFIRDYVDKLLRMAATLPEGAPMREAAMLRADHALDLVKAWRESQGA
jgi:hypothetical protein